jgi:hypothetical protein
MLIIAFYPYVQGVLPITLLGVHQLPQGRGLYHTALLIKISVHANRA